MMYGDGGLIMNSLMQKEKKLKVIIEFLYSL